MTPAWPQLIPAGLIGLCLGSFATTAALRRTRAEPALAGRSHCDQCGSQLSFAQSLPLWSFVRRSGHCERCGGAIEPLHPIGEAIGAMVVLVPLVMVAPIPAALIAGLGLILLASAVFDLKTFRLPDDLTLVCAGFALALAFVAGRAALVEGLIAGGATFLVLEGVRRAFLRLRGKAGLGFGDVKLLSALALWLGAATPVAVAGAAAAALCAMLLIRPEDGRLPFGPAIAAAGWSAGLLRQAHLLGVFG